MSELFAPHITSPKGDELFNNGVVTITWDKNDPPASDEYGAINSTNVTYEIEYTENYNKDQTNWHTLKRRIPWEDTSYEWNVGKMIKSKSVRIRMRSRTSVDASSSDWSMISGDFSINVFDLIAPAIVNPLPNRTYNDFVLIILDESLTRNTYHQKVRYTFEYSSLKRSIQWTTIARDVPVGQNVIRWSTESLPPSDDYVLRLTAQNSSTSCFNNEPAIPDQIVRRYVYNIMLQQSGTFIIDTKPPNAILEIENFTTGITNEINQTINIFAEDTTTEVSQIQLRECDATNELGLGNIEESPPLNEEDLCKSIEQILEEAGDMPDFDRILGKPQGYSAKTKWTFDDKSGIRKIEALLTDVGGNSSLQQGVRVFQSVFDFDVEISDFVLTIENRDDIRIEVPDNPNEPPIVVTEPAIFEVAYVATSNGQYWVLEPFPRLVFTSNIGRSVELLAKFNNTIYLLTYLNSEQFPDVGSVFRDDKSQATLLFNFPNANSIPKAATEFKDNLYIGLENGELWRYNGLSFVGLHTFSNPINNMYGDDEYLYIVFENNSLTALYNGTEFFILDMVP